MPRLIPLLCALLVLSVVALAQEPPPPPPDAPHMVLVAPPDLPPPPPMPDPDQGRIMAFDHLFAGMDVNGDGLLSREEMLPWLHDVFVPFGPMPEGELFCSEQMWMSEDSPQQSGYYCGEAGMDGELMFRSACNADGFDVHVFGLAADRVASCFAMEHLNGAAQFQIVDEVDGAVVYMGDGSDIGGLVLDPAGVARSYRLELDRAASSPDAELTIRYVDHPTTGTGLPEEPIGEPGDAFCSDAMWTSEQDPQWTNEPCGPGEGNMVFRSVCNTDGFDVHAISMPAGRVAGCFGMEYVQGTVWFQIITESDMSVVYEGDGADAAFSGLQLGPLATDEVYHVQLDRAASSADAALTVRFVDYPE